MTFKILAVDDNVENLYNLEESLSDGSTKVITSHSAHHAIDLLTKGQLEVDLLLLDIQMPELNGFELATVLRRLKKTQNIPIIFISNPSNSTDFEFKGYQSGAIDVLFRPVNIQILKSKINVFRKLSEQQNNLIKHIKELEIAKSAAESARINAENADRMKSNFLANMSHEIRTPLTAIIGFTELLKNNDNHLNSHTEYLDTIHKNGVNLIQLLNDILDISKIEAGELNIESRSCDFIKLIEEVIDSLIPFSEQHNVHVQFIKEPGLPHILLTDESRLRQILFNLLHNAIKFSKNGQVKITCEKTDEKLSISVKDTGIGIAPENQGKLFQHFTQLNFHSSQNSGGTGLGLSLSKQLALLMNAELELVESALKNGSTFRISLPLTTKTTPRAANLEKVYAKVDLSKKNLKGLKILFTDDSIDNQVLLQAILNEQGAKVDLSSSGIDTLKILDQNTDYDIILMDYKMPHLDGIQTTQKIREHQITTPVILLTANAMKGEKEKALSSGIREYITKPVDWSHLVNSIIKYTTN